MYTVCMYSIIIVNKIHVLLEHKCFYLRLYNYHSVSVLMCIRVETSNHGICVNVLESIFCNPRNGYSITEIHDISEGLVCVSIINDKS